MGQVWYLIVSIPDLCLPLCFHAVTKVIEKDHQIRFKIEKWPFSTKSETTENGCFYLQNTLINLVSMLCVIVIPSVC